MVQTIAAAYPNANQFRPGARQLIHVQYITVVHCYVCVLHCLVR